VLLGGASGTSPFYDGWRWLRTRLANRPFNRAHEPDSLAESNPGATFDGEGRYA
jgi:hypothetical protein